MRMGADGLVQRFGSVVNVAMAMIRGQLTTRDTEYAHDIVTPTVIAAAEARLRLEAQGILPSAGNVSKDSREGQTLFSVGSRFSGSCAWGSMEMLRGRSPPKWW